MTLKGDLDSISLADVFQTLSMTQQEGTLVVQNPEQRKRIYFTQKGVSLVTTGEKKMGKLGDLLVGMGKITQPQLTEALDLHTQKNIRLGEALTELGYVTQQDIEHAVRQQIEEEIYDLFSWENASFEFLEGPPDDGAFTDEGLPITKLTFNVNALIMEAARRIDEWDLIEKFIPTMKEIFIPEDGLDVSQHPEQEQTVLGLLDGTRSVKEIVAESHIPKFEVCKFLYKLLEEGKARRVEFEVLLDLGDEAVKSENLDAAVKFYEQAVEVKVKKKSDQVKARMRLAQALEYANQKKEAARHYKILAEQKLEEGDLEAVISIWQKVIEFDPLDLENKERLINLYLENRQRLDSNKSDMIQQIELSLFKNGRSLAMAFAYAGQTDRAKEVLNRLIELAPSNSELRKALVNIFYDSGDKAGAIEELEKLAHFLLVSRDYEQLLDVYKNVLKIDPARTDVRKKIAMIEGGEILQPRGRRLAGKIAAAVAVLAVLGGIGAGVFYQVQAMRKWEKAQEESDELWKKGERGKARALLDGLEADLPFTLVLKKIRQKRADFDEIEKNEKEKRDFLLKTEIEKATVEYEDIVKVLHVSNERLDDPALTDRIDALMKVSAGNPYSGDLPAKLKVEKEWLVQEIAKYAQMHGRALEIEKKAESTGQFDQFLPEAWSAWIKLYEEGRRVPAYWEKVRLPVRVETSPQGAEATVNGAFKYVTPFMYFKKPGESVSVKLRKWGYEDQTLQFDVEDLKHFEVSQKFCFASVNLTITQLFKHASFDGRLSTQPATVGETLVLATMSSGKVYAFEIEPGGLALKLNGLKPSGHPLNYGFDTVPAVSGGRIFLGCQDGKVYALDARSGPNPETRGYDTELGASGKIGIDGGGVAVDEASKKLFVGATSGLFAFDMETGGIAWKFLTVGNVNTAPLVHDGMVYFGCSDANFYCLRVSPPEIVEGEVRKAQWILKLPSQVTSTPVARGGMVYVAAGDLMIEIPLKNLRPDDPSTWKLGGTPFSSGGTIRGKPEFWAGRIIFSSLDGYVYAVETPGLERIAWRFNAGTFRSSTRENISPALFVDKSVFVGNNAGRFFSVDAEKGTLNWFRELDGRIYLQPAATESGVVFVTSQSAEKVMIYGFKE